MAVLPHLFLDDAGFECVARVKMGPMSVAYRLAIAYCKSEGNEKVFKAFIMWIVAAKLPEWTLNLIALLICKQVVSTLLQLKWPLILPDGTNCVPEAPAAKYEEAPRYLMLVVPLVIALATGYTL